MYYCPDCFWRPKLDYQRQQRQQQKEESLSENFFAWALNNEREEKENIRRRVYKSSTRPFGLQESSSPMTPPSGPPSTQDTESIGESDHPSALADTQQITEYVKAVVPDLKADGHLDAEWLQTVQIHMLSVYAQQNGFSLAEEQLLFDFFSFVKTNLSGKECLYLTKAVHNLCYSQHTDLLACVPSAFDDRPSKLMSMMLYCGSQLNRAGTKWMQQCLNNIVSTKIPDKQLQNMIIEASSKFWSPYDSICFMQKCSEKSIPVTDQKRILHLTRTHDLSFADTAKAMNASQCSVILQNLNVTTEGATLKSLNEVLSELEETELVKPEILEQVKKIVTEVCDTILNTQHFNITNPEERSRYLTIDALTKAQNALKSGNLDDIVVAIVTISCAIREDKGYTPRVTQLVSLTILLLSDKKSTSHLLEVMTGEGKSCIIAMFAAALATQDKHVDIITSSPILAYRDAVEWESFYKLFHLRSTHNILEVKKKQSSVKNFDADTERLKTYQHNIVYGTVSNFAADILREEFEQKAIRSEGNWHRRFDAVIADEVDLLMLDEGVQFTYLSHNASILHHIEPVLASVWCVTGQYRPVNTVHGSLLYAGKPDMFANTIFDSINAEEFKNPHDLLFLAQDLELVNAATVEALLSSSTRDSKQAALSQISIETTINFLKLLEPYKFEIFTANEKGLLTRVSSDEDVGSKDDPLAVKILVLPNGMACTLTTHEDLKEGTTAKVQGSIEFSSEPDDDHKGMDRYVRKHPSHVKKFMLTMIRKYQNCRRPDFQPENDFEFEVSSLEEFGGYGGYGGGGYGGYGGDTFDDVNEDEFAMEGRDEDANKAIKNVMTFLMYKAFKIESPHEQMSYNNNMESYGDYYSRHFEVKTQDCPKEFKSDEKYREWLQLADNPSYCSRIMNEDRSYVEWRMGFPYWREDPLYAEWLEMIKRRNYRGYYSAHSGGAAASKLKLPPFLKEFVTDQIQVYSESAIKSLQMLENREYAVVRDEDGSNGRIIPVDYQNSGVMEMNKKWGGGLQQMLEMKHNLSLSSMSVVTNFMSHVELFSRYKENGGIYGLSGTLGLDSLTTQEVLLDLFECDVCSIPTFKRRKLYEKWPNIVHGGDDVWFKEIMKSVNEAVCHDEWEPGKGRAVLLLCEDIKTATELKEYVLSKDGWKEAMVTLYAHSNVEEVKAVISRHIFTPGEMVIATNLAGRGTNIKLSPEVEKSGGLFCIMTFLPRNRRVELQAFGRTARKGQTGSVQCILNASSLPPHYQSLDLQSIRTLRAKEEHTRLRELINSDVKEVQLRETLFKQHCKFLGAIHKELGERDDKVVVVDSLNESWGQWLLMKKEQIERFEKDALIEELSKAQSQWKPTIPQNQIDSMHLPVTNFYHLIKFGNRLLVTDDKGNAERACQYFSSSVEMEPRYAAFAHYNHAYCSIILEKDGFNYMDKAIGDLEKAEKCLDPYVSEVTSVLQCVNIVNKIRAELHGRANAGENDLTIQMQVRLQVIGFIKKKIKETIDKLKGFRKDERHVYAEALGVFSLIPEADDLTNRELHSMWQLGMEVAFTVEAKPMFCWEALIVFLIGIAEIIGGVLLAVFTVGAMANFGMALISEGISDCIDGIEGMVAGSFSWVEWGISKAAGIAISLVSGGIGRWLSKSTKAIKIGASISKRLKTITKISKNVSKWGLAAESNLMRLAKEVGKEVAEQAVMKGVGLAQNEIFAKALEDIERGCREDITRGLREAFSKGELGNTVDVLFIEKLPDIYVSDDRMLPGIRDDARVFFKRVADSAVSSLMSTSEVQKFMMDASQRLAEELAGDANIVSLASGAIVMSSVIAATKSKVQKFSERFIPRAEKVCLEFLDFLAEDSLDGVQNLQGSDAIKNLTCAVVLKEELAHLVGEMFAKAVTAILENNESSHVNQELGGSFNEMGNKLFEKHLFRSDETMEQLKAVQSANYIRFIETNPAAVKPDDDIVEKYVKRVEDTNTPGSTLELRILAEHFGVCVAVFQDKNGKLICNCTINPPSGATRFELLLIPPSDDHPTGHYKLKNNDAQSYEAIFDAFVHGRNPGLPEREQREEALSARKKVAEIIGSQPDLWRDHILRRLKMDLLERESYLARVEGGN